jgi:uncharacterized protein
MTDEDTLALADRLFGALEAGDLDAVSTCYADDVAVWANYDDRTLDKARSLRAIRWLFDTLADRRYEVGRRELIPDGFVQEHRLCGTTPAGTDVAVPVCVVATVAGGQISHLHEYLDPAWAASLSS